MNDKIKVLIVDDHPFFREGVKLYLNTDSELDLVAGVSSGKQALEIITTTKVDVIVMDLQMPGMDGISSTEALLERDPSLRILMLTSFGGGEKIQQALAAGAAGYCLKDAPPAELAIAIKAVAEGGTYLGRGITSQTLTLPTTKAAPSDHFCMESAGFDTLTERELDVLRLLAQGLGNKEIAEKLYVGDKTVKTHVANILQKLDVKTRTQAALLASRHGIF
ncbi:MAG: LuxR family transcriptional regulator [Bacillota bacterium]|nr:MAG: LuxR family transcriptional regulator [Bacillota bacterium]